MLLTQRQNRAAWGICSAVFVSVSRRCLTTGAFQVIYISFEQPLQDEECKLKCARVCGARVPSAMANKLAFPSNGVAALLLLLIKPNYMAACILAPANRHVSLLL